MNAAKFWSLCEPIPESGCWIWMGRVNQTGRKDWYGRAEYEGGVYLAHGLAWVLTHGRIPDGMFVCHRCDTPLCVNPNHLFIGTANENNKDRNRKGRTKVPRCKGHKHGQAKLTEEVVISLRRRYAAGEPGTVLAREVGMDVSGIYKMLRGESWGHVWA